MTVASVEADFKKTVSEEIRLLPEGTNRFRVFTPFRFGDGDHLAIVLKWASERWLISDEGHTYMHLSYDMDEQDFQHGNRRKIIDKALAQFGVTDDDGVLLIAVNGGRYGDALFSYVQALLHISDVTYLNREFVKSTFMEDFRALIAEVVPTRREFNWYDQEKDPDQKYVVDCRIERPSKPLFAYGIPNDDNAAT